MIQFFFFYQIPLYPVDVYGLANLKDILREGGVLDEYLPSVRNEKAPEERRYDVDDCSVEYNHIARVVSQVSWEDFLFEYEEAKAFSVENFFPQIVDYWLFCWQRGLAKNLFQRPVINLVVITFFVIIDGTIVAKFVPCRQMVR